MDTKCEINDYLQRNETVGALLITGKWGCGKTSLIKSYRDESDKEKYTIVIISLFGINSVEMLIKEIKKSIFFPMINKENSLINKTLKAASALTSVFSECSKKVKVVNNMFSVDLYDFVEIKNDISFHSDVKEQRKLVLIFDDFERCNIDKSVLLGTINDFVENKGIKTIIVADEEKINDDSYNEFKEKAIFKTIKIESDYNTIIANIVDAYNESNDKVCYKKFLKDNINIITNAFKDTTYENIRVLKAALYEFERVFETWENFGDGLEDRPAILYKFIAISSEYKINNYKLLYNISKSVGIYKNENDKKIEKQTDKAKISYSEIEKKYRTNISVQFPNSLLSYIYEGEWNADNFHNELNNQYHKSELSDTDKFLIYPIWEFDSKTLKNTLQIFIKLAYEGKLSCKDILQLFIRIHKLREIDSSLVENIDYTKINLALDKKIRKIRNEMKLDNNDIIIFVPEDKDYVDEEALPIINKMDNIRNKIHVWEGYNEIKNILQGNMKNWQYNRMHKVIDVFDEDLLLLFEQKYDSSNNMDRIELSRMLLDLEFYKGYHSEEDYNDISCKNMKKLLIYIEEKIMEETDTLNKYVLNEFKEKLTKKIRDLQPTNIQGG